MDVQRHLHWSHLESQTLSYIHIVFLHELGGFHPFEKDQSDWINCPSRGENGKSLKPPPTYPTPKTNLLPPKYLPGPCGIPTNFLRPPEVQESPPPRMFQVPGDLLMSHHMVSRRGLHIYRNWIPFWPFCKIPGGIGNLLKGTHFLRIMQDKSDKS